MAIYAETIRTPAQLRTRNNRIFGRAESFTLARLIKEQQLDMHDHKRIIPPGMSPEANDCRVFIDHGARRIADRAENLLSSQRHNGKPLPR